MKSPRYFSLSTNLINLLQKVIGCDLISLLILCLNFLLPMRRRHDFLRLKFSNLLSAISWIRSFPSLTDSKFSDSLAISSLNSAGPSLTSPYSTSDSLSLKNLSETPPSRLMELITAPSLVPCPRFSPTFSYSVRPTGVFPLFSVFLF